MTDFDEFIILCKLSKKLCPWSSRQDIKRFTEEMIGEAQEVLDAISEGDKDQIKDELGDVLIDWTHACLSEGFDIDEIISLANAKIRRRKPFLEEGRQVTLEEAKTIWRKVKEEEKMQNRLAKGDVDE